MGWLRDLAELADSTGLTSAGSHLVLGKRTALVRHTGKRCLCLRMFTAKGVIVGNRLWSLRCGRCAPASISLRQIARRGVWILLLLLMLLSVELLSLCLEHLLVLHPSKLILLLLLLVLLRGHVVARGRLPKRLLLILTSKHGQICCVASR